ncbi:DHH family phosphoesterase [Alkalimarinus coralli]|uniref:DHH family phosphoesterase n=1 Tax=Alkalimarinus coralli TaxID=2935863 RepID=UPI00202AC49E|nr:hypothetical protein [Alkalimarinus coralli]
MLNDVAPLVIYHGTGCLDGFGSAYAAYRFFKIKKGIDAEYLGAGHGDSLEVHVEGRDVYILDFSYKREELGRLCDKAANVVILDHHESAQKELAGLDDVYVNLTVVFDMNRSGAVITWEYFHEEPVPPLLAHIQDRDLWQFRIPDSKHVNAALMSYPYEFELWDEFANSVDHFKTLVLEGRAINRFRDKMIETYKKKVVYGTIEGFSVPIVCCPNVITSELLSELAVGNPFAAAYSDRVNKRGWSLRSVKDGQNVATIAAAFGGGGHPNAAGFSTDIAEQVFEVKSQPPSGE